ncbi:unnamed protein product [Ilex paraguariensis]|uniref:Uncharacterized protein n=1 Tax=Ilex paraguariensis TaxID=185542 RepID=A0ABC8RQM8_9AQUA
MVFTLTAHIKMGLLGSTNSLSAQLVKLTLLVDANQNESVKRDLESFSTIITTVEMTMLTVPFVCNCVMFLVNELYFFGVFTVVNVWRKELVVLIVLFRSN